MLAARLSMHMRTRCTRTLEEEIARLRAENRALVNSILGVAGLPAVAGIPPMRAAAPRSSNDETFVGATLGSPGRGKPRPRENRIAGRDDGSDAVGAALRRPPFVRRTSPNEQRGPEGRLYEHKSVRRRSWQQIGRALEIEDARAARRERESNTDTFPAPRTVVPRV